MGETENARKLFAGPCEFLAGAASLDALPVFDLPEVAFVGRSNVGKSSLINALVGRTGLARVSHTPGRTRQINLFRIRNALMLADLPGYGFARVSKTEARNWNDLIVNYLRTRKTLRRIVLLLDARRGVMASDEDVMRILDRAAVSFTAVLTKIDALTQSEAKRAEDAVTDVLQSHPPALPDVVGTSARTGGGIPELRMSLAELVS